jgi:hypothetical protein
MVREVLEVQEAEAQVAKAVEQEHQAQMVSAAAEAAAEKITLEEQAETVL